MKRIASILVCLAFLGLSAFSQDIQITGMVTSADDGNPLPGVSVVVKGTTTGVATDINGNFSSDPLFCDTLGYGDYRLAANSPCLPDYNDCGVLIGAYGAGCYTRICGDVNGDYIIDIFDITHLIFYLYMDGLQPVDFQMADVNGDGELNIFDISYLISYLYLGGPAPNCP